MKVLFIDDEPLLRFSIKDKLQKRNFEVDVAETGVEGLKLFNDKLHDVVLTDLVMPQMNGIDVLKSVKSTKKDTFVILFTAYGTIEKAVEAMKLGAHDFVTKPFSIDEIVLKLEQILRLQSVISENVELRKSLEKRYSFGNIIGASQKMREIYDFIETVADSDVNVLIFGESGTGKEMVANAIHYHSQRKNKSFVKVSCASLSETLLESELFGHEKGAFTGATTAKIGRFEKANGGTIFLDEIGDISLNVQVKLLRVLQEKQFERVGGTKTIKSDMRVICATLQDLNQLVKKGQFRRDLLYRINTATIMLPPVRERVEDIPLLANHFLKMECEKQGKEIKGISEAALDLMESYSWPGNVREIKNVIERAVLFTHSDKIQVSDLPPAIRSMVISRHEVEPNNFQPLNEVMKDFERKYIQRVLAYTKNHKNQAAKVLGISRKTLWEKLKNISN